MDIEAMQKWNKIPKKIQDRILENVFCSECGVTTIVNFSMHNNMVGILLNGNCKKCDKPVSKLIEG